MDKDGKLVHREVTDRILGSYFTVYNALQYGYSEVVYHRAMLVALRNAGLVCETEKAYSVIFQGVNVGDYRADLVVEDKVIIEIKSLPQIEKAHASQCFNYLKVARLHVGLILNFGPKPEFQRHFLERV